ncbi:hypothetical protein VPNG_01468 [Cytospora leucostoma]|uniref:DUF6546 domain-containing protein n=1 Tax=Cytospora leucostoma TaxID=1230097 RepID=A0A423XJJ7_9PEZI|nr:hypothetical protein VPNG_01468 [Cytospora leucostoma]
MPWKCLPLELRLMILENLRHSRIEHIQDNARPRYGLSAYTAVCGEWQHFFEEVNFKHLILRQSDIPEFERIVQGSRRTFVKWIWLRMVLPKYDCDKCNEKESLDEVRSHNYLFTKAIWNLFEILSVWGKKGEVNVTKAGVTLELSAHSPSDAMHSCKELKSRIKDTAWGESKRGPLRKYTDKTHGWIKGRQVRRPSDDAKIRVFGPPSGLGFDLRARLTRKKRIPPRVDIVGRLVVRRQFYRHFSVTKALYPIFKSLTQLRQFTYEPWRGIDTRNVSGRTIRDDQHHVLFSDAFKYRRSLRIVSIFEDFNNQVFHPNIERERSRILGQDLARSSRHFEELHVALNVDARDFFHAFWPGQGPNLGKGMQWNNLKMFSSRTKDAKDGHDGAVEWRDTSLLYLSL